MEAIEQSAEGVWVRVRVQPRASRNQVRFEPDGRIRVALTAPPVDGEANAALIAFLAKQLAVPRGNVRLVQGEKSREKAVVIAGLDAALVRKRLLAEG